MNKKQMATLKTVVIIVVVAVVAYYVFSGLRNMVVGKVVTETVKNVSGKMGKMGQ